jgi:nicotinamide mononucleotide transporter
MSLLWFSDHIVEIFGAVTGIVYVFLEIRRNILLWPLGIITSAVYMLVFRDNGFYAGMVLQGYYLVISVYGWWLWKHGTPEGMASREKTENVDEALQNKASDVRRLNLKTGIISGICSIVLCFLLWYSLDRWTDSPVPLWDGLITSLSVVATWMLTRKILEQWHIWIVANSIAVIVYLAVGMYPTAVLFFVYDVMAVVGLLEWRKSLPTAKSAV